MCGMCCLPGSHHVVLLSCWVIQRIPANAMTPASSQRADSTIDPKSSCLLLRGVGVCQRIPRWVWLKINYERLRKFWSMFPLTRVPFWYVFFSNSQMGIWRGLDSPKVGCPIEKLAAMPGKGSASDGSAGAQARCPLWAGLSREPKRTTTNFWATRF